MKILLANDDGLNAPGLRAAAASLREVARVVVSAPDREQSGVGASVTLNVPVRATKVRPVVAGVTTYAIEGTPADSVILALERLVKDVDLVVAGINSGANLGEDVFISGTVGAALQGYVRGLPAIAISIASLHPTSFQAASSLLQRMVGEFNRGSLPSPSLLNVNLPPLQEQEIEGIDITCLSGRAYTDRIRGGDDGRRKYFWISRSKPPWEPPVEGTDIWTVRNKRVSITPLHTDLTASNLLGKLQGLPEKLR